jgi:hypothetical protein
MFAEQLAPYLPNFPFSPTEPKFIAAAAFEACLAAARSGAT